jgi:transcriptional regulator with XRE-family HTH domain
MKRQAPKRAIQAEPKNEAPARKPSTVADLWLGMQVRDLRRMKGLSLKQLGERAGLSVGMLSQIERGLSSPSIRSLRQISEALGVPPARFFHEQGAPTLPEIGKIVRRGTGRMLRLPTNGVSKQLLTPDLSGALEMLLVVVAPGGSSGPEHYTHKGEECGHVLSGSLSLWIGGDVFALERGDSFRFTSTTPHRFENPGRNEAQVLWIITPPLY